MTNRAAMVCAALAVVAALAFAADAETPFGAAEFPVLPGAQMKSVEMNDDLGMYEVATENGSLFYLTRDMKYLIMGSVMRLPGMQNVTEERKAEVFRVDFASLPLGNAVKISEGSRKLAVFGSPDCPWCRKLHEELKKLKDTAVHVFLVPYGDPDQLAAVWCAKDAGALERAYAGEKVKKSAKDCTAGVIAENGRLAKKMGISSYPTVIMENGKRVTGYVKADRLEEEMTAKYSGRRTK